MNKNTIKTELDFVFFISNSKKIIYVEDAEDCKPLQAKSLGNNPGT